MMLTKHRHIMLINDTPSLHAHTHLPQEPPNTCHCCSPSSTRIFSKSLTLSQVVFSRSSAKGVEEPQPGRVGGRGLCWHVCSHAT